jgi:hypothetical protein
MHRTRNTVSRNFRHARMKNSTCFIATCLLAAFSSHSAADEGRLFAYRTQAGDTLIRIASRFLVDGRDWQSLQRLNGIKNPNAMPVGSIVNIRAAAMRTEPAPVRVTSVQGNVLANGSTVQPGVMMKEGDRLATGDDGFVTILLADGSTLTVQSKSAVKLETARQLANTGGVGDSVVRLESGRVETIVAKQRNPGARYEIRTPTSNMGVRGTVFRVAADDSGSKAASEVLEGKVNVAALSGNAGVALVQGYGTVAEKDKAPLPPIELLPAPAFAGLPAEVDDVKIAFAFAPVARAVKYRGQLARDAEFKEPVADVLAAEPNIRFAAVAPGKYFLRARAIDNLGLEGNNGSHRFSVLKQLAAPVLSSALRDVGPSGGAAPFVWQDVSGAKGYRIQVSRDDKFANPVIDDANVNTTRFSPAKLLPPGDYSWRVAAVGEGGRLGAYSVPGNFSIVSPPPVLAHRTINGVAGPLTWSGVNAPSFRLQIAQDEWFQKIVVDKTVSGESYVVNDLGRGLYFARIRAAGENGVWSDVQNFELYR